jgi:Fe-S cluster biosynthesis and repair protein YggX
MPDFRCNKCGGTSDPASSPDGRAHGPLQNPPTVNDYWQRVQSVVCQDCWDEWKGMEVKVINEYRLNMLERDHRKMLKKFMHDYLNIEGEQGGGGQTPDAVAAQWRPPKE